MARREKPASSGPNQAYIVSFGDTMTTLLAFFIVLVTLAEEQTGANLYNGTGSFVRAMDSFGLPGSFPGDSSANAIARNATTPQYIVEDPEQKPPESNPTGPDEEDNAGRVIDREAEEFQRFLHEMERLSRVDSLPGTAADVSFDFFDPFNPEPPYLSDQYMQMLAHVLPLLGSQTHRVEIVIWATTPKPSAWRRATDQAGAVAAEIAARASLSPVQQQRLQAVGKPWISSDAKRPVMSVVVRKTRPASDR